jgi:class 3 adenylate cyclase/pimeloyl-ACP methyl ester carboxylesterase
MEPRIQYAQTKDGVSIAFWTLGEGVPPLLYTGSAPFTHIGLEWQNPDFRRWWERYAQTRKFIRLDSRGSGLSERNIASYSLDAHLLDLEAVVDRLGLARLALYATFGTGPVVIAYAARHPQRVSHLILLDCYMRGSDFYGMPRVTGLRALLDSDWEMYTETVANVGFGWAAGEPARRFAAFLRECTTPEFAKAFYDVHASLDVTDLLGQLNVPTLVLQRQDVPFPTMDIARGIASRIPDARLVVLKGRWLTGELEPLAGAIEEFLGEGEELAAAAEAPEPSAFRTVLFTDVEGSTALTQRLGDAKARDLLRQHERMVREALKAHGGSEVKTTGDGFMTSFSSATRALESAIAMQRAFAQHNESAEEPILVRVGLNAGEPVAEEKDLFGTAVNLAARICGHAEAGQILASDVVRQLVAGKDFLFADRGEAALKGFDEPVRLFEVRWQH